MTRLPTEDEDDDEWAGVLLTVFEDEVFGLLGNCKRQLTSSSPELPLEEARSKNPDLVFRSSWRVES